jgi:F-type H+-transporting ATPase subunit c
MKEVLADRDKWIAIASLFALGIAAFGAALGQGRALASALDGITRNPGAAKSVVAPMIIGLSLIEALVIYVLVVACMYYAKVG